MEVALSLLSKLYSIDLYCAENHDHSFQGNSWDLTKSINFD